MLAATAAQAQPGTALVASGFSQPPCATAALTDGRVFVVGKAGAIEDLFIAIGDGGGNDPDNLAQNRHVLLGEMLRIDVNRDDFASPSGNDGVPTDNPCVGQAGTRGERCNVGLRKPFRNSFDRLNGNLWIADVGQGAHEEFDFVDAASGGGQNFGRRIRERRIATPGTGDAAPGGLTEPLLDDTRGFGASVTGGCVARGPSSPLFGRCVLGEFVSGRVSSIAGDGSAQTMGAAVEPIAALGLVGETARRRRRHAVG